MGERSGQEKLIDSEIRLYIYLRHLYSIRYIEEIGTKKPAPFRECTVTDAHTVELFFDVKNAQLLEASNSKTLQKLHKFVSYLIGKPPIKKQGLSQDKLNADTDYVYYPITQLGIELRLPADEELQETYLRKLKSDIEAQIKTLTPQSQEPQAPGKIPSLELSEKELKAEINRIFKKIEFDELQVGLDLTDEQKNVYKAFWSKDKNRLERLLNKSIGELTDENWGDLLSKINTKINNKKSRLLNQIAINVRQVNRLPLDQLDLGGGVYNDVVERLNWSAPGLFFHRQSSYAYLSNLPAISATERELIQEIILQYPPESQKNCIELLSSYVFINSREVLEINLTYFARILGNLYNRLYPIAKKQVGVLGHEQIALYPHGNLIRKLSTMEGLPDLSNSSTTTDLLQKYTCWQYIYFSGFINVDRSTFTQDQLDKFNDLRDKDVTLRQKNIYQLFHEIYLVLKQVNDIDQLRNKLISGRATN